MEDYPDKEALEWMNSSLGDKPMTNNTETELPSSVYEALGWQGGTVHQVIEEIQSLQSRIKELEAIVDIKAPVKKRLEIMNRWELENYIGLLEKQLKFTGEKFKLSRIENERLKIDNEKLQLETGGQAFQDDTMALLCALGLGDHARSESCHKIIVDEIIPKIQLLAQERDICKQLFYDEQAVSRNRLLQFQQLQSQLSRMEGAGRGRRNEKHCFSPRCEFQGVCVGDATGNTNRFRVCVSCISGRHHMKSPNPSREGE